ncbi:hypothetical protein M758_7G055000 [Ceratodon purpureus]|nr:hypothetical protein M758_7G055000 [Ceratodon purpureus]
MHSYDYGTKMEKKRDNWTQLQKFFKKRSFVVMKDEIETIISCQTPDGAGPLLERMYKFLTMKRCKPEEAEAEKKEKQQEIQQDWKATSELATIPSVPVSARVDFSQFTRVSDVEGNPIGISNLTSTTISAVNNGAERTSLVCSCIRKGDSHGPPCFNPGCQHFISVSNSFYSIQRETLEQVPGHQNGSGVLLPLQSNVSFSSCGGYNQFNDETDNSPPRSPKMIDCRDENQEKDQDKGRLSAVERARQREGGVHPGSQQKILNGDHIETIKPGSKTTSDVALAFRSPHRQRKFKQYTISDYRRQQTAACVQLGKLGPDLEDEELGEKREKLERMKEFGRVVRSCNTAQVTRHQCGLFSCLLHDESLLLHPCLSQITIMS